MCKPCPLADKTPLYISSRSSRGRAKKGESVADPDMMVNDVTNIDKVVS
jgi:hypothetical protein